MNKLVCAGIQGKVVTSKFVFMPHNMCSTSQKGREDIFYLHSSLRSKWNRVHSNCCNQCNHLQYRNVIYLQSRHAYSAPVIRDEDVLSSMIVLLQYKVGGQNHRLKGHKGLKYIASLHVYAERPYNLLLIIENFFKYSSFLRIQVRLV